MIDRLHQCKAIDDLEVGTLHRLRKFGNRASHEDETVNPATSAILSNIAALRGLQGKHLGTARKASLTLMAGGGDVPPVSACTAAGTASRSRDCERAANVRLTLGKDDEEQ
jgi:hypothetical protein